MPLYEYECTACHRRTEKIQKFSDAELTICPHCGGTLERTVTAAAFAFAGGGWYKDGYGSAKPAAAPADSGSASSPDSGSTAAPAPAAPAAAAAAPAASTPSKP
jgi:putative FmdB family regulatory protein